MKLIIPSFPNGGTIPEKFALGVPDPENHVRFGANRNPHLRWEDPPSGTRSFAIVCHDPDVPTVGDDVNQEGKTVPADLPRTNFYHWVLVDVPVSIEEIPEAAVSDGVTPHGKPVGPTPYGRAGKNDYTGWFSGNPDMDGVYGGYDGPGPPWNDERLHHYVFSVYALNVERLDLPDGFDGPEAVQAIRGKVLAQSEWVGTYAIYEKARKG